MKDRTMALVGVKVAAACLLAFLCFAAIAFWLERPQKPRQPVQRDRQDFVLYGKALVRQFLKNPDGAKFAPGYMDNYHLIELAAGHYELSSYVDATNAFGGTIRSPWRVHLQNAPVDTLKPLYVEVDGRPMMGEPFCTLPQ